MASLTDTLSGPNYTPQAIGGARQTSLLEGLADTAGGILKTVGSAINSGNRGGSSPDDNPALDEYAMKVFETKTGIKLGDPGYDQIVKAQRIERAKANGTMSAAMYDIQQQGNVAELIRKNPANAREIMADAYNLHGVKDELFREAAWASKEADAVIDRDIAAKNSALNAAAEAGRYDPREHSQEYGISQGLQVMREKADMAAMKARYEAEAAQFKAGDDKAKVRMEELQKTFTRRYMSSADQVVQTSMQTMQMLMTSAGSDVERNQMLDEEFMKMQQGLMLLGQSGRVFQSNFEYSFPDKNGVIRSVGFDPGLRTEWDTWLQSQQTMVTQMMGMDLASRKRFIERFVDTSKISAIKQFPTLMGLKDSVFGGSFSAAMDFLANGTETMGVDPLVIDQISKATAEGIGQWSNTSLQAIKEYTVAGALPSSNPNAKVAEAAFTTNTNLATVYGAQLKNGKFADAEGQRTALEGFRDSQEDTIYAVRANYTPNSIDLDKTTRGMKALFNDATLKNIDAFVAMGGSKEDADQFYMHGAIAATTFVDGLKGRYAIQYNKTLKRFIPMDATEGTNNVVGVGSGGGEFSYTPARPDSADATKAAMYANSLLSFIEAADQRKAVIDPSLLKEGEMSLRDVIGSQEGLAKGIEILSKRAQDRLKEGSDAAFKTAVDAFTDETQGRIGGMNVNPFNIDPTDNSASFSSPSGQYNLGVVKAPEELQPQLDSLAEKYNLDPSLFTALIKQESGFNPNAKGPVIEKFKGTPDERAIGYGQLLPSTAKEMGVDANDPAQNLEGAAKYLSTQMDKYNNPVLALMAYNWGPTSVDRWLKNGAKPSNVPAQTADYVKRILKVDIMKGSE